MARTATNPTTIGNATKKSDYNKLWDNADLLFGEHGDDGAHSKAMVQLTANRLVRANASKILTASAMEESAAGEVVNASQPAFLARLNTSGAAVTGEGSVYTVIFDTEVFDQNADFDISTGIFTAPVAGRYRFECAVHLSHLAAAHNFYWLSILTSNREYAIYDQFAAGANPFVSHKSMVLSCLADMDAGDTAKVTTYVSGGTGVVVVDGSGTVYTFFSGSLVC
jgi:hypothetical protein